MPSYGCCCGRFGCSNHVESDGRERVPPQRPLNPLHHRNPAVRGGVRCLKLLHSPLKPAHEEKSERQPVCDDYYSTVPLRVDAPDRVDEACDAVVHIQARLAVRKAIKEPPELVPFLLAPSNRLERVEIAKLLLRYAWLFSDADDASAVQLVEQVLRRLRSPHVGAVVQVHALIPQKLAQPLAAILGLLHPEVGQGDAPVGHEGAQVLVQVTLRLPVPDQQDLGRRSRHTRVVLLSKMELLPHRGSLHTHLLLLPQTPPELEQQLLDLFIVLALPG
mmetsp:Transcript_30967/g.75956  ORF Transcript_30967/g.75956 Transcript_30967/m.75956 type:complete len:276 (-) Transcript_30967:264-1091(-)